MRLSVVSDIAKTVWSGIAPE